MLPAGGGAPPRDQRDPAGIRGRALEGRAARLEPLYDSTFSRTVWRLYGGAKGLVVWYYKVGPLGPSVAGGGCAPDGAPAFDSTRAPVSWRPAPGGSLASVAGGAVRLRFTLAAASLYSFWVSDSACGASGGVVGAGGPGTRGGRDLDGSCPPA